MRLKFHITEKEYTDGVLTKETDKDLTDYDSVILSIKYFDGIVDYDGTIDNWAGGDGVSYVVFELFSEDTTGKSGKIEAEIRGIKWVQKNRLNTETIKGQVLHSLKIPVWTVSD